MTSPLILPKTLVLVGMMGAGKTAIGRRLATRLALPFIDADAEIEQAAGSSIPEIFERHGEAAFREGERRVIARLLRQPVHVLATGGGAFMDETTRATIAECGLSLWLRAEFETLWRRVNRRGNRPLLQTDDPEATLKALMAKRYPVYAEADITVDSSDRPRDETVDRAIEAVANHLAAAGRAR